MVTVAFEKYFVQGTLGGLTVAEEMTFTDFDRACAWAGEATMDVQVDYVVQNFRCLETGETENF